MILYYRALLKLYKCKNSLHILIHVGSLFRHAVFSLIWIEKGILVLKLDLNSRLFLFLFPKAGNSTVMTPCIYISNFTLFSNSVHFAMISFSGASKSIYRQIMTFLI